MSQIDIITLKWADFFFRVQEANFLFFLSQVQEANLNIWKNQKKEKGNKPSYLYKDLPYNFLESVMEYIKECQNSRESQLHYKQTYFNIANVVNEFYIF